MNAPAVTCRSIWHRAVTPAVAVDVWRTQTPEGVTYAVGLDGNGLDRLEPEQATMLAGIVLLAGKFAKREQDLAGAGRRRRPA
jgi:hypothetical protein